MLSRHAARDSVPTIPCLSHQAQPQQIILGPSGLQFDHAPKRLNLECVARPVVSDGNSAAIRMNVALMAALLAHQIEAVPNERGADLACGNSTQATVIKSHLRACESWNGDGDSRLFRHFDVPVGSIRDWNRVFLQLLNHHLHDFLDMFQGFFLRSSPSRAAILFQSWGVGVPAVAIGLDDDSEGVGLHEVSYP